MFVEVHLNSSSAAICYCTEKHKNKMIFLYELFINSDEYKLELEFEEKLKKLKKIN